MEHGNTYISPPKITRNEDSGREDHESFRNPLVISSKYQLFLTCQVSYTLKSPDAIHSGPWIAQLKSKQKRLIIIIIISNLFSIDLVITFRKQC